MHMLFVFTCFLLLAADIIPACFAARVELSWNIGRLNISRDGYSTWESICINNALPIPPVHVTQGDTLVLHIYNLLSVPTSVHAHGIHQNYTDYYDGAEMVTGCPIPPGGRFTYVIETRNQVGNFWIHGHVHAQYTDGFRTPFIIHEEVKPTTYDVEELLYFEDWDDKTFDDSMIIGSKLRLGNGQPTYYTMLTNGINSNNSQPLNFVPGKRYHFRILSLSTMCWIKFRLPGHQMVVVAKDGVESQPLEVDGLDIGPGQRYSVIVTAHNTAEFNYNYTITQYSTFITPFPGLMPRDYTRLIQYKHNAPLKQVPAVNKDQLLWGDAINMQARDKMPLLPVDRQIVLSVKQFNNEYGAPYYSFSDYAFNYTRVPSLFTALTMGDLAFNSSVYGLQAQAHVLHYNESIEVLLYNNNSKDHSMHLHMMEFQVVEVGPFGDAAGNNMTVIPFHKAGPSPMRCDTVTVKAYSYIKLRFRVDRGSVMLFHCHMVHGDVLGLAATFIAAPNLLQKHMNVPDNAIRMCKLQGIKTSGNAAGNNGFDLTGLEPPTYVYNNGFF